METATPYLPIAGLARTYQDLQKVRISLGNKMWAGENGNGHAIPQIYEDMATQLQDMEKEIIKSATHELKHHPAYPWLKQVKGLGPTLACQLIGYIREVERFPTVSKMWKYCGIGVTEGKADRPKKGEKVCYSPKLKTICYNIGISFLRAKSPYTEIYYNAKVYYEANRPDWTKNRIHLAALRKMEKIFLSHLWQVWREAEGLPIREAYVFEYLGHTTYYPPDFFIRS